VRLKPIFDTNIFGDVGGRISEKDWRFLVRHSPHYGWPLSDVTAWELLVGVNVVKPRDFPSVRQRIGLAYDLSKGRVLQDPRVLMCRELLRIPPPTWPRPLETSMELDVIRRADSLEQLLSRAVPYKGKLIGLISPTSYLNEATAYKQRWLAQARGMATAVYPGWEDLFQKTGKRVPLELRKEYEQRTYWERQRVVFSKGMLRLIGAPITPELVAEFSTRLDAAIEFSIFVVRQFMFHNYSIDKHLSDAFDQLQLFYLAVDRFIIISSDPDILLRTRQSQQAARIMSFDKFLQTF